MFALLLLAAAPQGGPQSSPGVGAAIEACAAKGDDAFIATIRALANRDDASAIELLGEAYMFGGLGLVHDPAKACALFAKAAERRGDSAHNLARCFEKGDGLGLDAAKARQWYRKGAAFGYPKSNCALGNLMIAGTGGRRDVAGGVALCREAAEAGEADAQTDLGNYLLGGIGGARDIVKARKWYALAAEQNQANAQFVLGQIYWNGDGTPVDRDAAVKWWKQAYAGGRKDAAGLIVGGLFKQVAAARDDDKTGIARSPLPETLMWLERAASEDPDLVRRQRFAETLAELKGG